MFLNLFCFFVGFSYVAIPIYWFLNLTNRCRDENLKTAEELWNNIHRNDDEIPIGLSLTFAPLAVIVMCVYWTLKRFKSAMLGFIVAASRLEITIESNESKESN